MSEDDRLLILVGFFGIGLRVLLLVGGSWQDAKSEVRYTDIDYNVFTDAAGYVASGESPYLRSTYRYTPLLAYVLLPNIWAHDLFGKIIFCAAELQATRSVVYLLKEQKIPNRTIAVCTLISLINPYTATISTRGNGEAIVFSMLLCMVSFLAKGQIGAASIWYGLATHWRLFPIIHCIPLLCFLGSRRPALKKAADKVQKCKEPSFMDNISAAFSLRGFAFGCTSAATFLALGGIFARLYGAEFLEHALLYHTRRVDPRHNFSPRFYSVYQATASVAVDHTAPLSGVPLGMVPNWLRTFGTVAACSAVGIQYAAHLPFCMMIQTMVFVAFNPVCTGQYFVWYLSYLPLVLPWLHLSWRIAAAGCLWVASQLHWLGWAYFLEFEGKPVFLAVWWASILFFASNIWLIWELMRAFRPSRSFQELTRHLPKQD